MKKLILVPFLFIGILYGCSVNTTYRNRESDKNDAEHITNNFYALLQLNQFQKVKDLFSDTFFSVAGNGILSQLITRSNNEFGTILNDSLIQWQTVVVNGTNANSEYLMRYEVSRTKKHTIETFSLRKEAGDIKIIGYNVSYNMSINEPSE